MLGVLLAGPVMRRLGRRWTIGINIVGNAVMFAAPALTTNLWLVGVASLVGGVGGPMWAISAATLQQRLAPAELLGRVSAAARFLGYGGLALGPLVGGLLAQQLGVGAVFLGSGMLTALMLIPYAVVVTERAMAQTSSADPVAV
jgi:MFS family permease